MLEMPDPKPHADLLTTKLRGVAWESVLSSPPPDHDVII